MKNISNAFAFVFSDDDWFNKVLVGGLYLLLIPLGIGGILILGFQVELVQRVIRKEQGMPMWRNFRKIVRSGFRIGIVSVSYTGVLMLLLWIFKIPFFSVTTFAILFFAHFLLNPLLLVHMAKTESITACFNIVAVISPVFLHSITYLRTTLVSIILVTVALLFGWMWIVVGWPLLIFLALLIQTLLCTQFYFDNQSD